MCLVALAIDESRRFPLVIAANRDEFFRRPSARLGWWQPEGSAVSVLGGRDLEGGGTWLGLTAQGRLALVTNVRNPKRQELSAPSRGRIVLDWLAAQDSPDRFWMRTAMSGFNGFNLIAADFRQGECFWASNHSAHPQRLDSGVHGLSNAMLDTPWPKVAMLKQHLSDALQNSESVDELSALLFDALADRSLAADEALPETGVPRDLEKLLSAAFIRTPDGSYGTRCSTLIITERVQRRLVTHVLERSFSAVGPMALLRRSQLKDWPPRYTDAAPYTPPEQEAVSESEMATGASAGAPALKRTRVRSLLKPQSARRRS
jgi:uncharacterized protein with NRDE domain